MNTGSSPGHATVTSAVLQVQNTGQLLAFPVDPPAATVPAGTAMIVEHHKIGGGDGSLCGEVCGEGWTWTLTVTWSLDGDEWVSDMIARAISCPE